MDGTTCLLQFIYHEFDIDSYSALAKVFNAVPVFNLLCGIWKIKSPD